jgi:hypothetical protein
MGRKAADAGISGASVYVDQGRAGRLGAARQVPLQGGRVRSKHPLPPVAHQTTETH